MVDLNYVHIIAAVVTTCGSLLAMYLGIKKWMKEPVEKLHSLQEQIITNRIDEVDTFLKEHVKQSASLHKELSDKVNKLEVDRLEDKQMIVETIHSETEKIREYNQTERAALHERLNDMQNTISRVDERSAATVNSLGEINNQLSTIVSKVLSQNNGK